MKIEVIKKALASGKYNFYKKDRGYKIDGVTQYHRIPNQTIESLVKGIYPIQFAKKLIAISK